MIKTSELWSKDVINVVDGRRLGVIEDVELDLRVGKIESVIIPGRSGLFGFFGGTQDIIIEWNQVQKIGEDVILVKVEKFLEPEHRRKSPKESEMS